jgi:hypothetical protein
VVVAAVVGFVAGQGGDDTATPAGILATNGDLALRYKTTWTLGGTADAVPGLKLTGPIALRSEGARIVAGKIARPGPGLLPVGVRPPAATSGVTLGQTPALRHTGIPAAGGTTATVFVVATDRGPEAIACVGATDKACESVAATLRLNGADALDVQPSEAYATGLSAVLADHARRDSADRRALAGAATSRSQAAVAVAAARAQAELVARTRSLAPPDAASAAHDAVVAAMAGTATGYKRLADAARAHDAGRYRRATATLDRASARLSATLGALKLLGYQITEGG